MKYFFDTEFHEYHKQPMMGFFEIGNPIPTIDLISIGIVAEDGREYYAVSKEFNLEDAWNSFQIEEETFEIGFGPNTETIQTRVYWLRDNVLYSIWNDNYIDTFNADMPPFTFKNFKFLIEKCGKSKQQIAKEINSFVGMKDGNKWFRISTGNAFTEITTEFNKNGIEFYAYYADYDWVVLTQLFGKMINLPNGFHMYCIDLKQMLEDTVNSLTTQEITDIVHGKGRMKHNVYSTLDTGVLKSTKSKCLLDAKKYSTPSLDQTNKHNALADARWNYELYKFLNTL